MLIDTDFKEFKMIYEGKEAKGICEWTKKKMDEIKSYTLNQMINE